MDKLTRKDLKSDKFAEEVQHTVEYFGEHRRQVVLYGGIALAVVLLVGGTYLFLRHQRTVRQRELRAVEQIMSAPVGQSGNPAVTSFPTQEAKDAAVTKALAALASEHSGSDEGVIARYYMGTMAADRGRLAEAEKALQEVANSGNAEYASLAKLALAQVCAAQGRPGEGEKLLRSLVDKPTAFVSKAQATIALARLIAPSRPDEARKLLEPLRAERGAAGRLAIAALGELPPK